MADDRLGEYMTVIAVLLGGVGSWLLTGLVRRYALSRSILDVPNHRSSHSVPTPRGGGVAIAMVTFVGVCVSGLMEVATPELVVALVGGGSVVAVAGWLDDRGGLPAAWRALIHSLAALWALIWIGGFPTLNLGVGIAPLGAVGLLLGTLGIVWCINLFNFMDGIDGIAAGEAISITAVGGLLLALSGAPGLASVALLLTSACAGFLVWNWQPAKIFMGDVGSGLVGFIIGVLAVASENSGSIPLLIWVLLAGVFVFDATATLLRRFWRGERWYEAHRGHAYQRATQAGCTHAQVTLAVLGINGILGILALVAWLFPTRALIPAVACGVAVLAYCYFRVERLRPM